MSFNNYKDITVVLKDFRITYNEENFVGESDFAIDPYFLSRLQIVLKEGVVFNSEYAICENIIAPILQEVWLRYKDKLLLWSHQPLNYDEQLSGVPDYIIARRSEQGKIILESPYLILVEAKKDNFEEGWGQCLAELVAAQKLNQMETQTVFGCVSNGKLWEFAKLQGKLFTKNLRYYTLEPIELLMRAIDFLFSQSVAMFRD